MLTIVKMYETEEFIMRMKTLGNEQLIVLMLPKADSILDIVSDKKRKRNFM